MLNHLMVDQNETLDDFLLFMPGVQVKYQFGHPSYTINGKLFCTVTEQGIMVRLPEVRISELIQRHELFRLPRFASSDGNSEWLCINREATHDYGQIVGILEEAVYYSMTPSRAKPQ